MKRAINILESEIRVRKEMIALYEGDPHNQAITESTAKYAKEVIKDLERAVGLLNGKGIDEKWELLRAWLETDKNNGMGHKVNRALFLMDELDEKDTTTNELK